MPNLFIRAPFEPVTGSTAAHYNITASYAADRTTTVEVDGTPPARLNLQPVFPGKLTFKPDPAAVIPADPSATGAAAITGDLYLELSPLSFNDLRAEARSLAYPLVFAYLGVTVDIAFFNGTALKALQKSSGGYKTVVVGGAPLTTKAQLTNHFAQGHFSIEIKPTKTSAVYTFPKIQTSGGSTKGSVKLALGVRTTIGPLAQPATLASVPAADVMDPPHFASLPIPFFYRFLRHLAHWTTLAATGHETHVFFSALDALENATPLGRWRRLRVFPLGDRTDTVHPMSGYDDMTAGATDLTGGALWSNSLTRLGEVYKQRIDNEDFRLQITNSGGVIDIMPTPVGALAPQLDLKWTAPAAGQEPLGIDITANIPSVPDPLAALVPLEEGAYDQGGRTFNKDNVEIAQQELVRPLQLLLKSFGFGVTKDASGSYDIPTRHAVREFQREARTTERTKAGALVPPATVTPFTGAINGKADVATLTEMGVWKTKEYRSTTTFYVMKSGTRIDDVGYADSSIKGWSVFANAGTPMGFVPNNNPKGLSNTTGLTLTSAITNPATAASFPGAIWEKRAICEVVHNEAKVFEALNTWDDSFLSVGLFQWTLGNTTNPSELPGVCSTLSAADFNRLFGKWGLATTSVTGALNISLLRGKFTLDGTVLSQNLKEEFRSFRWAYRFFQASQDMVFKQTQYTNARSRLNIVLAITLTFTGTAITASQLLQSELLRAMALDQHVNRPSHVQGALQACANALHDPDYLISSDPSHPPTWVTDCYMIRMTRRAKAIYGSAATATMLTAAEAQAEQDAFNAELTALRATCVAASTSTLGIVPATGTLATMTQAQHDALAAIYKWRRENTGTMTDPAGRWNSIATGGHTGTLGALSTTPGVFTP